jgi:hypothetical protein
MIAGAIAALALASAPGGQAGLLLVCVGYNDALQGTVQHTVVIREDRASIDGRRFAKREVTGWYSLRGPMIAAGGEVDEMELFEINRVDGSYTVLPVDRHTGLTVFTGQMLEWSRPQDTGCAIAKQKF